MALAFARLLTGKFDEDEALAAFDALSDGPIYDIVDILKEEELAPSRFFGFLFGSLRSNTMRKMAADAVETVRTFSTSPTGEQILKLAIPPVADLIIKAFLSDDDAERDALVFRVIRRLSRSLATIALPRGVINGNIPTDSHVARIKRPALGEPVFPAPALVEPFTKREGDFPIEGLFSPNDLEMDNTALFRVLTRETLSGVPMTFEAQFKRHLAWRIGGAKFEAILERLEADTKSIFKTPKAIPKGWPGWSPLGGVMMSFDAYVEALHKMRFASKSGFLRRVGLEGRENDLEAVFHQQRALWLLRHLTFNQSGHTYVTLQPLLKRIKQDIKAAGREPKQEFEGLDLSRIVPESVFVVLQLDIASHDNQGRFFTRFEGGLTKGADAIEAVARIPHVVLARILRSSPDETYEDPIFAQRVARDISARIRTFIGKTLDLAPSPASSSADSVSNSLSILPTVDAFLSDGRDGTGLRELEASMIRTSSTNIATTLEMQRSLARSEYSPDTLWAVRPSAMMVSAVEPLAVVRGAFAAAGTIETEDINAGYAISVLADRLSTQTYFTDAIDIPTVRSAAINLETMLGRWSMVYPKGQFEASYELLHMSDVLGRGTPLDGIESSMTALQAVAGRRVELASGPSPSNTNIVPLDAETYPVFDFMHSAFVEYHAPFGRCWSWLRHSMLRQGVEMLQNDQLYDVAQDIPNRPDQNAWTWLVANGTHEALERVLNVTARVHELAEDGVGLLRTEFDAEGLAEPMTDEIHPASLLMAYISGDVELDLEDVDVVYTTETAPLMSFIVGKRLTNMAIRDLGVPLFTDNLLFKALKALTEAMVQHLDAPDGSGVVEKASATPLGQFVVEAARGVRNTFDPAQNPSRELALIQDKGDELIQDQSVIKAAANNSESFDDRVDKLVLTQAETAVMAQQRRTSRMHVVASLWPGAKDAIKAIDAADQDAALIEVGREFALPIYAIVPVRAGFAVSAVSQDFVESGDVTLELQDGIFAGVNAQKDPNRFAREVQDAVLLAREMRGGPTLSAVKLASLEDNLRVACESVFSLGALLTGSESVEPVVDAATLLVGDGPVASPLGGTEPLHRLYPDEPFDFGVDSIQTLAVLLLQDLNRALRLRLVNRTPGPDGLTLLEKASLGPLSENPLYKFEINEMPVNPIVRTWVGGAPKPNQTPTWKTLVVVVRESGLFPVSQSITPARPSLQAPANLDAANYSNYIDYAESLAFLYDRIVSYGVGLASASGLGQIYQVAMARGSFSLTDYPETLRLITSAQSLSQTLTAALVPKRGATLANLGEWITANTDLVVEIDGFLRRLGYWQMRDLAQDTTTNFARTKVVVNDIKQTENVPLLPDVLATIDAIEFVQAWNKVRTASFPSSQTFDNQVSVLASVLDHNMAIMQSTYDEALGLEDGERQARVTEILTAIDTFLTNTANSGLKTFVRTGEFDTTMAIPLPAPSPGENAPRTTLEETYNVVMPALQGVESTNTGRFALWSAQVQNVAYYASKTRDARFLLWPWTVNVNSTNMSAKANSRGEIGLSKTFKPGVGWVAHTFQLMGTQMASTFATLLYKELKQVKQNLGPNRGWPDNISVAWLVDAVVGRLPGTTTLKMEAFERRRKRRPFGYNPSQYGQYLARAYTVAPEIMIQNNWESIPGFYPSAVAAELVSVRGKQSFDENFLVSVEDASRWDALHKDRQTRTFTRKAIYPRYGLTVNRLEGTEATFRQVQSCFTAAHTTSVIQSLGLVANGPIATTDQKTKKMDIYQPAVIVAGMLRPTEPLIVRFNASRYGVWMRDGMPVLALRIQEMIQDIANTELSEVGQKRFKKNRGFFFRTAPIVANKDKVTQAPDNQWLMAVQAELSGAPTRTVDFSGYRTGYLIEETFAEVDTDTLKMLWSIMNFNALSGPAIEVTMKRDLPNPYIAVTALMNQNRAEFEAVKEDVFQPTADATSAPAMEPPTQPQEELPGVVQHITLSQPILDAVFESYDDVGSGSMFFSDDDSGVDSPSFGFDADLVPLDPATILQVTPYDDISRYLNSLVRYDSNDLPPTSPRGLRRSASPTRDDNPRVTQRKRTLDSLSVAVPPTDTPQLGLVDANEPFYIMGLVSPLASPTEFGEMRDVFNSQTLEGTVVMQGLLQPAPIPMPQSIEDDDDAFFDGLDLDVSLFDLGAGPSSG